VVSHDREFIDNTATSVLLFEGQGIVTEIFGGFNEVAFYQQAQASAEDKPQVKATNSGTSALKAHSEQQQPLANKANKLSYKLKRELEVLPAHIESIEQQLNAIQQKLNDPEFFRQSAEVTIPVTEQLASLEKELMEALERWDYLENLQGN
jgi:ATP-binding cassette subfamily F protein uup